MGTTAILFGIACAAVFVIAALSRSRASLVAAVVLCAMWTTTKVWDYPLRSDPGLMLEALNALAGGIVGLFLVALRPSQIWRRVFLCCMLATLFAIFAQAWSLVTGSPFPKWTYTLPANLLYGIAIMSVATPGVVNGASHFRRWMFGHHHGGSWRDPGSQWGRTAKRSQARKGQIR